MPGIGSCVVQLPSSYRAESTRGSELDHNALPRVLAVPPCERTFLLDALV